MGSPIAYFSMEVGVKHTIPTYSGGLGVLVGDTLKSAADMGLPVIGVTLLHRRGYFKQRIDKEGQQAEEYVSWDPEKVGLERLPSRVKVTIDGNEISVGAWRYTIRGRNGHVPVYFLDADSSGPWGEDIASKPLYTDGDYRLAQEVVLGVGGLRFLQEMGHDAATHHMNESHSALLVLELLRQLGSIDKVRERCVFTIHTPIAAGHERFDNKLARKVLGSLRTSVDDLAGKEEFNMTALALNGSRYTNGVSKRHGEVTRVMFPKYEIDSITNGAHSYTWTSPEFQVLYDIEIPEWRNNTAALSWASQIEGSKIAAAHRNAKRRMTDYIEDQTGVRFDPDRPALGWARRITGYKRPELLFRDMDRLRSILKRHDAQLVIGGKAHPKDPAKPSIEYINRMLKQLRGKGINAAYIPNYGMDDCAMLTAGCDVWENTPRTGEEASGTSGMCAAHNGVPQHGTLDGWWLEGHDEGVTGWSIGGAVSDDAADAEDMYQKLDTVILPQVGDTKVMKGAISRNAAHFNTERMLGEYIERAYKVPQRDLELASAERK